MTSSIMFGVDPGYRSTGLALVESSAGKYSLLASETLKAPDSLNPNARVAWITRSTARFLDTHLPGSELLVSCAIEDQANVSVAKTRIKRTSAAALRCRDVANRIAGMLEERYRRPVMWIEPMQAKRHGTGYALASKKQVGLAMSSVLGTKVSSHVADGVAIAISGARAAHAQRTLARAVACGRRA